MPREGVAFPVPNILGFIVFCRVIMGDKRRHKKPLHPLGCKGFPTEWRRMDSNHRSRRQQIYSLPPLATQELLHMQLTPFKQTMELVDGFEPRPADYKSAALPTELHQRIGHYSSSAATFILSDGREIVNRGIREKHQLFLCVLKKFYKQRSCQIGDRRL